MDFLDPYNEFNTLHTIGHMGHVREYSAEEVVKFLENTGFKPILIIYTFYEDSVRFKEKPLLRTLFRAIRGILYKINLKWQPCVVIISEKNK